jgi:ABC-type uncharacterized transport system ATPase subunit
MFFVEPVAGAIIGKIWEERRLIAGFSKDFFDLISKGRLKIFVFGCAGTGKSTFGKILDGQDDVGAVTGSYTLSSETEYYGLKDKRFVQILQVRKFIISEIGDSSLTLCKIPLALLLSI